jgi:hypothetical protein
MAAGGNFDINSHLSQMGFGGKSDGGGGSGEAMTPDSLIKKGIDKAVSTYVSKIIGLKVNTDLEGKSALAGFEAEGVGSGLSPSNLTLAKDLQGAGPLGMFASIFKYFTRDVPQMFTGGEGGGGEYSGGGGGGDYASGGGGGGGDYSGGGGGHSDYSGMPSANTYAAAADMPEMRDYGGKMMPVSDMPIENLGNLRPTAVAATGGRDDVGGGMSMG